MNTNTRILFINFLYDPFIGGGTEVVLRDLVGGAKKFGHEVKVLTLWGEDDKEELINGVPVYRAKIPNLYFPFGRKKRANIVMRKLWRIVDIYNPISKNIVLKQIKEFKPDLISIHNLPGWSCSVWDAVDEADIPAVQVLHDTNLLCPNSMFKHDTACKDRCFGCKVVRFPCKLKSNKLKAVVGVSNFILNKYLSFDYFKDVPIKKVIYNSTKINASIERKVDKTYINFGFIGGLMPFKGIELLLKTYLKIKKPNYRLFVAGSGKYGYDDYLKSTYKDDSIIFMGRVEPKSFFEKVDVVIVPSTWYENFPGVIVESFAFGIPVIGSNIGGIPELIKEGLNGIVFDPYKENDLEEKMIEFENNVDEWRNKTEIIRQSAQRFLDYEKWLKEWESLYSMLLKA
jgi:glycosyltransferase involved in cell wall biosynthesis